MTLKEANPKECIRSQRLPDWLIVALAGCLAVSCSSDPQMTRTADLQAPELRWILAANALSQLQPLDPTLVQQVFDNARVNIQSDAMPPSPMVPPGWSSVASQHFTCVNCEGSLANAIGQGTISPSTIPVVMFDDENWSLTPVDEQQHPCDFMRRFTKLAHRHGFVTILAPDQNLANAATGITTPQGGEQANWQIYLRLGLAACAAQTGTERYHIMSQPFESHWCDHAHVPPCEGGESDFINFVTEAALQARAVNPNLVLTAGLSTNPRYQDTAIDLFQDSIDVMRSVDGFWLNVTGDNNMDMGDGPSQAQVAIQYLQQLEGGMAAQPRSSVFFPRRDQTLAPDLPANASPATFSLATVGASLSVLTAQTLAAGTMIPAGAFQFQFWTDGDGAKAKLALELGYCAADDCSDRVPIIDKAAGWTPSIAAGARGAVDPGGAFVTTDPTMLPVGGPSRQYRLYFTVTVEEPGRFNLLYDAATTATNVATTVLLPHGDSLFKRRARR
jgi:hypothetical protein